MFSCEVCNGVLVGKQKKFCSPLCRNRSLYSYQVQQNRGIKRKLDLITKLGGACIVCGYNKNVAGLSFHHKDPKLKKFSLTIKELSNRSWVTTQNEALKCDLMCLLCHTELHNPQMNYELVLKRRSMGELDLIPTIKMFALTSRVRHGTLVGYRYHKCRCRACKDANNTASRNYAARKRKNNDKRRKDCNDCRRTHEEHGLG